MWAEKSVGDPTSIMPTAALKPLLGSLAEATPRLRAMLRTIGAGEPEMKKRATG
jgi:hypothetical protein